MIVCLRALSEINLSQADYDRSVEIGKSRHEINASDNRGAGTNEEFHVKGVIGETVILRALGLTRFPKCLASADPNPDVPETWLPIEVKCGTFPIVERIRVDRSRLYVFLKRRRYLVRTFQIARIATGAHIITERIEPEKLPRAGTEKLNWEIPDMLEAAWVSLCA